jgi:Glycosyl hydrolase family 71
LQTLHQLMSTPIHFRWLMLLAALLAGCSAVPMTPPSTTVSVHEDQPPSRPKKIFAHYMGCYPVASGPTAHHRQNDPGTMHHLGKGKFDPIGDRWRNWPLVPEGLVLSTKESVHLEIKRAMRIGIDGFTVDAWAGGDGARNVLDAMFEVVEEHDYPFELTITLDDQHAQAIRELLSKHGNSPKLARRDGKPLVFGYLSVFNSFPLAAEDWKNKPEFAGIDLEVLKLDPRLRATPEGWEALASAYRRRAVDDITTPLYLQYCIGEYFHSVTPTVDREKIVDLAAFMAREFPAIGMFLDFNPRDDDRMRRIAQRVQEAGAEWCQPIYFQYENIHWGGNRFESGTDLLRNNWRMVRETNATLLQFVTWNDYTENTMLAPSTDTQYAMYDLNAYYIQWWKSGQEPVTAHDRVYITYRKYPQGSTIFPFQAKQPDAGGVLEVLTILTAPARVHLPGRDEPFDAPAGLSVKQFPLVPGKVCVELLREGNKVVRLDCPEPITDRPFREQNSMVCFSTEFERHWNADFPGVPIVHRAEYADDDQDGLPNWFEMYYFGTFMDYSTATVADPKADTKGSGKSNLQHYLDQTDPGTKPPPKSSE